MLSGGFLIFFVFRPLNSHADAFFFEGDKPLFVKLADGFLKCFLADAEKIADQFGRTFIGDRNKPTMLLQSVQNFPGFGIDGLVARLLKTKIYLLVVPQLPDESINFLADFQGLKNLVLVKNALMRTIDDGDKSYLGTTGNHEFHFLALMKIRLLFVLPFIFGFDRFHSIPPMAVSIAPSD